MKEFKDIAVASGKLINSLYLTFQDSKFEPTELTNFVDDIFPMIEAFTNAGGAWPELQTMTNEQKAEYLMAFKEQLVDVPEVEQDDITGIFTGATSVVRLFARKSYKKGLEDGQKLKITS